MRLRPVDLPRIPIPVQFALHDQGWTTVSCASSGDSLWNSSRALFDASKAFFAVPDAQKETYKTRQGSEEGWSRVEGEKEMITLRSLENMPPELRDAAIAYWSEAGGLLNEILGGTARTLELRPEQLTRYSEPCIQLGSRRTATMMRLFRYEGEGEKTVAEPHKDLGLLSLVMCDTPGLEVWNRHTTTWFPIEQSYAEPAGSLLVGRQLERLSNERYRAGPHRVQSYPSTEKYRYSIVFILRAHSPVPIDTDELTTAVTGAFEKPLRGITAFELFRNIRSAHFNINTAVQEREEQRRKLEEKKCPAMVAGV